MPVETAQIRYLCGVQAGSGIAVLLFSLVRCHTTRAVNDGPNDFGTIRRKRMIQMAISKHGIRSVAVAMSAISLLGSASALACGGDWYPELQIDPRIHGVAQAEQALKTGDYVAAAGFVVSMMPHIKTLDPKRDPLVARAERVLAMSIARSGGKLGLEREVPSEFLGHCKVARRPSKARV